MFNKNTRVQSFLFKNTKSKIPWDKMKIQINLYTLRKKNMK